MGCFTGPVRSVHETRIFARHVVEGTQFLAYAMAVDAPEQVAMVLPIPVAAGAAQDAVRFVDLSKSTDLFERLDGLFPRPKPKGGTRATPVPAAALPLPVEKVGAFEASFVPRVADFARLDARFRLPDGLFTAMPAYSGFGFVVFKLAAGNQTVHPMAFTYPSVAGKGLFFPTVHVHDGAVHDHADFDHVLYAQRGSPALSFVDWEESPGLLGDAVDQAAAPGVFDASGHLYRRRLHGSLPNQDTLVAEA
jgi:hypothetical protein